MERRSSFRVHFRLCPLRARDIFVWGENAPLRAWTLKPDGKITFLAESQEIASAFSTAFNAMPGGMITLSADGDKNGIAWGSVPLKGHWNGRDDNGNANQEIVEGVLRAYYGAVFDGTNANGNPRMKLPLAEHHARKSAARRYSLCLQQILSPRS